MEISDLVDVSEDRSLTGEQAQIMLNAVLDSGINFIDTSIDYGRSEEIIGKYISHRRSEFYLASKCGCPALHDLLGGGHIFTRENIVAGVNQSLERLNTDYIDIIQLHNPTVEDVEKGDLVSVLNDLRRDGKVRWIGVSATLPHLSTFIEWGVFDEFQIPYSALLRDHEDVISRASFVGMGIVIRGGVSKGEPGVSGVSRPDAWSKFDEANLDDLREDGESRTAFVLRFTLSHSQIHTIIVGTQNRMHLDENVAVAQRGPLSIDVYEEAKSRLSAVGVVSE
jgi:aryl-alcohol dehydrogenase-like predicted oxidoreductase